MVVHRLMWIATLVMLIASLPGCSRTERSPAAGSKAPIRVTVATVAAIDTAERLEAGAVVAARHSASISSRIVAPITGIRVTAGDRVRAGEVLITLDARDVTAQAAQARATALAVEQALAQVRMEHAAAEAEHRLAAAWQQRVAALHSRNSATAHELDEAEARLATAGARLAGAQAAIDVADAQLASARAAVDVAVAIQSFTDVRAPFDGLVTERLTDPGNLAAPGVPLLRIDADGGLQVVARVDEARAGYLHVGDRVDIFIDDTPLEGLVGEVAPGVGPEQRTFTVKVTPAATVTARTGSFARLVFRGATRRALSVPADAIQRQGQVTSVFAVEGGVARLRLIRAGAPTADGIEVLAGLEAGESIVVSPLTGVADGVLVSIDAVPTPAPAAP
jgi:RND family efflux transporter MFP subunit